VTPPPPGTPARVSLPPTQSTEAALRDEEEFNKAATTQLANTRKTAENWKNGLAGLLTLVTTVLFIKGKSTISEFTPGWRIAVGVLLLAALAVSVWGTWLGLRAAYGTPKIVRAQDVAEHGGLTGWRLDQTQSTIDDLNVARILAVLALCLVAAVFAFSWWTRKAPPAYVSVTQASSTYCGELTRFDYGTLDLRLDSNHSLTFAVQDIDGLRVVSSCP
jgi:hypothetical protein